MPDHKFLVRAPLLDPKQQVVGYRLAWQSSVPTDPREDVRQLLDFVGERAHDAELGLLFLDAERGVPPGGILAGEVPSNTVLMLDCPDLAEDCVAGMASMREQGLQLALRGASLAFMEAHAETLLPLATHIELPWGHPDFAALSNLAKQAEPPLAVVVQDFPGWAEFDKSAAHGVGGFFGQLCTTPRPLNNAGALSPQAIFILQLMQMVQENADVRHIEGVLKRDAALSYKLFRYINSPGFGIEVEIESLRHAVTMLGYTPLFRWLSVLLATTNTAGYSHALLQAAIVRGRFAELLGKDLLPRGEAEHLFFVGMFSLLDQLLGIPLEKVVSQILLPEPVVQALLGREGVYGPFLSLVEACEQRDGRVPALADALFVTSTRVNQAHLAALAWAHTVTI
ncbi:EAL and HDOD domain-containing protein [Polaromonas sp. JS666]|uniref:EAL and HDOD domain-containing protein n=1 Tax=Polaromonas sp. (strain JS666 / ATCC BAA-500) TaxID=296591 RepID=UPI0008804933|nr:HDOD domain-containing protein [Polaromonas sp. JS666]SDO24064.1 EAL and modified HD-GYP domain-containing signal transduction protein [Polaromonas sp. JS666]